MAADWFLGMHIQLLNALNVWRTIEFRLKNCGFGVNTGMEEHFYFYFYFLQIIVGVEATLDFEKYLKMKY